MKFLSTSLNCIYLNQTKHMIEILSTQFPRDSLLLLLPKRKTNTQTTRTDYILLFCKKGRNTNGKSQKRISFLKEWFLEDKHPNHYLYPCTWIIAAIVCTKAKVVQAYQIQCWLWGWHLGHLLNIPSSLFHRCMHNVQYWFMRSLKLF